MLASEQESIVRELVSEGMKIKIILEDGLVVHYNGIDFLQTRDIIKIHFYFYIQKILENHKWQAFNYSEARLVEPLHSSDF